MNHLKPNDVVEAEIVSIEHYGLWCRSEDNTILILIPDTHVEPGMLLETMYSVGQVILTRILLFAESENTYRGTLKSSLE